MRTRRFTPPRTIRGYCSAAALLAAAAATARSAAAQVVLDGTLGPGGAVPGPNFVVPASAGQLRGGNLFHSFSELSVAQGEVLEFTGPAEVSNIVARVTGANASTIDGTIGTLIPKANLILINPRGITFGPNAAVVNEGSFVATTADFVRLADGTRFNATTPAADTVLTSARPEAFGFLGPQAGPININGARLVRFPGQTLSVVGGPVTITQGTLQANGGRVNIVAAAQGTVAVDPTDLDAPVDGSQLQSRAPVSLSGSFADVSGNSAVPAGGRISIVASDLTVAESSGVIAFTAGDADGRDTDVNLTGTLTISGGSAIATSASGAGRGGNLTIDAAAVRLIGSGLGSSFISAFSDGPGDSGEIRVRADSISIDADRATPASISASSSGSGRGGDVIIDAREVTLLRSGASIDTAANSVQSGRSGDVRINAATVSVTGGASLRSVAGGNGFGGLLRVDATEQITVSGSENDDPDTAFVSQVSTTTIGTTGGAAGIVLNAPRVRIANAARVDNITDVPDAAPIAITADTLELDGGTVSANTSGPGRAGSVDVNVRLLEMDHEGDLGSSALAPGGTGGPLTVNASERVRMQNGAEIAVFAGGGAGNAGNIAITSPDVQLFGGSILSTATVDSGDGGTITVNADRILFSGPRSGVASPALVTTPTTHSGVGGTVFLNASESIILEDGARVATNAGLSPIAPPIGTDATATTGKAGDILLVAPLVRFTGTNGDQRSRATSTTDLKTPGTGAGGSVTVTAERVEVLDGALLNVGTEGTGAGGNVVVLAGDVLVDNATLSASSTFAGDPDAGLVPGIGGGVGVVSARSVVLRNGALISVESVGTNGGTAALTAGHLVRLSGSSIVTRAGGTGGDILIGVRDPDTGRVQPRFVVLSESAINANAVAGNGGNIRITSQEFVTDVDTILTATSEQSDPGRVDVSAGITDLAGSLIRLPGALSNDAARLEELCGMRLAGQTSSFIATGRGGAPLTPDGLQPSFDVQRRR